MDDHQTRLLLVLTLTSLVMLTLSLWMAWSVRREVRRLVAYVSNHMEGLVQKQHEVLREVAGSASREADIQTATERVRLIAAKRILP